MVQLNMKCRFVEGDIDGFNKAIGLNGTFPLNVVQVKVGDRYVQNAYVAPTTYSDDPDGCVVLSIDGTPVNTYAAKSNWSVGYQLFVGGSEPVGVDLAYKGALKPILGELTEYNVGVIITQLELIGVGDDVWTGHVEMRHAYVDDARDMLEVSVGLTTRESGQRFNPDNHGHVYGYNARPGVVTDMYYPVGGYVGGEKTLCPMGGIVMRQLKARYGEPHVRYSVTVDGRVLPTDTIAFGGGKYTVEGYERDIVNNTTKIIID
jgi:hypothetical protein